MQGALAAQAQSGLDVATAREADAAAMKRLKVSEAAALERQKESGRATKEAAKIRAAGTVDAAEIKASAEKFFDSGMAAAYLDLYGKFSSSVSGTTLSPQEIHDQIKATNPDIAKAWELNVGIRNATPFLKTPTSPPSLDEFKAKLIDQNPKVDLSTMKLEGLSVEDYWTKTYGG